MAAPGAQRLSPDLERLFGEAANLDEESQRRYLDQNCSNPQLRAQVERLLQYDRGSEEFLHAPVAKLAMQVERDVPPSASDRIGPYRIVRQIGSGGMGAVYEAERLDGEIRLRVAI